LSCAKHAGFAELLEITVVRTRGFDNIIRQFGMHPVDEDAYCLYGPPSLSFGCGGFYVD
jgi:hypothetical protein